MNTTRLSTDSAQLATNSELSAAGSVLLIQPPFTLTSAPYISLAALAPYLLRQGIPVAVEDANLEFWIKFLTPERILGGLTYAQQRLQSLNAESRLTLQENIEYRMLVDSLTPMGEISTTLRTFQESGAPLQQLQTSKELHQWMRFAVLPEFPDLVITRPFVRLFSRFSEFSSADILQSVEKPQFYGPVLDNLLEQWLIEHRPRVVGLSVVFQDQMLPAFYCARKIRQLAPHVHINMGGPFISVHMRELHDTDLFQWVDSFILDEGEIPLETLYRELSSGCPNLFEVPALVWVYKGEVVNNPSVPPPSLAELPPLDYTQFDLDRYLVAPGKMRLLFRLSRGCYWQKCTFCRTEMAFCRYYEQPDAHFCYQQLLEVSRQTGVNKFFFSDESCRPDILESLSRQLMADKCSILWRGHTRVDKALTRERCVLYRQAGCQNLTLGVESFNPRVLALMRKGTSAAVIDEVLENAKGVLPIMVYMIVGFPTQSEAEIRDDYARVSALLKEEKVVSFFYSFFQITYGSAIWNDSSQFEISRLLPPSEQDLAPDVYDFACSGMPREAAALLYITYMRGSIDQRLPTLPNQLQIGGKPLVLRYDIQTLKEALTPHLFKSFSIPYGQWFDQLSSELALKPKIG